MKQSLIPQPQKYRRRQGFFKPRTGAPILLPGNPEGRDYLLLAAETFQSVMARKQAAQMQIYASFLPPGSAEGAIELRLGKDAPKGDEGYRIAIRPDSILVVSRAPLGLARALATLGQLSRVGGAEGLPCVDIEDWPRFEVRGYMLDISRGKVPTFEALCAIVDDLAAMKYNHFQLYCEHVFTFRSHPQIGGGHSPMTPGELLKLDRYCSERNIELVPNLQSFGHQHHILKLPKYEHLAESDHRKGWTLSPACKETYGLLADMYSEYLPLFRSEWLNISCDETYDLGQGKTLRRAKRNGVGRVYLDHILKLRKLAARHGKQIMMWGDIVQKHPDIVPDIPDDILMLDWYYRSPSAADKRKRTASNLLFSKAGLETIVCPGTNTWRSLSCRTKMAHDNIRWFSDLGARNGARGVLLTDWGDDGHMNLQGFSLYPMAIGANSAWNGANSDNGQFDSAFSLLFFGDSVGRVGHAIRLLADSEKQCAAPGKLISPARDFLLGQISPRRLKGSDPKMLASPAHCDSEQIDRGLAKAAEARDYLSAARHGRHSRGLDLDEHIFSAESILHAYRRARLARMLAGLSEKPKNFRVAKECEALREDIKRLASDLSGLWLKRSKPSDLDNNLSRLRRVHASYSRWAASKG